MRFCVRCPGCGEVFEPPLAKAGAEVACPRCSRRTRTPKPPPDRARPPSPRPEAGQSETAGGGRPRAGWALYLWLLLAVLLGGGGGLLAAIWGLGGSGKSRAPAPQAVPAGPPAQAPPEKATVIPVGGKPAAAGPAISMKCAACGHDFKAAATDVTAHFTRRLSDLYGGDIDKMLDKAQKDGGAGYPCPKCGRAAAAPDAAGMPDAAP